MIVVLLLSLGALALELRALRRLIKSTARERVKLRRRIMFGRANQNRHF